VVATGGKWLAAFVAQKLLGYSVTERNLIFGLSNAQAAATLAAVVIGYNVGLLNEYVLNGSILMILVTCLMSSLTVESAGRQLALAARSPQWKKEPLLATATPERILVPIADEARIEPLLDLALMIRQPRSVEPLYPLVVVKDEEPAEGALANGHRMLEQAVKYAASTECPAHVVTRVDPHVTSGIVHAVNELQISTVLLDWNGQVTTQERIFGTLLDSLLMQVPEMIVVSHIRQPLNVTREIVVLVPAHAERESGFQRWLQMLRALARQAGARMVFAGSEGSLASISSRLEGDGPAVEASYRPLAEGDEAAVLLGQLKPVDLLVVIMARRGTVSYSKELDDLPARVGVECHSASFVFVYPEQDAGRRSGEGHALDTVSSSLLQPAPA
jgi:hypothetical protein